MGQGLLIFESSKKAADRWPIPKRLKVRIDLACLCVDVERLFSLADYVIKPSKAGERRGLVRGELHSPLFVMLGEIEGPTEHVNPTKRLMAG